MQQPIIIASRHDLMLEIERLCLLVPIFRRVVDRIDLEDETALPLRRKAPDFSGLANIVVSQQVSTASAAAIWGRLVDNINPLDAGRFLEIGEAGWIAAGLSRAKQQTLKGLATAILDESMSLDKLASFPVEEIRTTLMQFKGIGPWSADVFMLSCIGHGDAFPAGDIALQEGARDVFGLEERPDAKALQTMSLEWSPHRASAARLLWAHYSLMKNVRDAAPC